MDVTKLDKEKGRDVPKFTQSEQRSTSDLTADTSKGIFTTRIFPYGFSAGEYPSKLLQETIPRITIPLRQRRLETWGLFVCLFVFLKGRWGMVDVRRGRGYCKRYLLGAGISDKKLLPIYTKPLLRLSCTAVCSFFSHTPIDTYNYMTVGCFHM